jgi:hypothetical protein
MSPSLLLDKRLIGLALGGGPVVLDLRIDRIYESS